MSSPSTTSTLQSLLTQAMLIVARYRSERAVSGERFNIFRILDVQTAEVRTHSAFLAELLRPDGSHGLGTTFLQLFVQTLGLAEFITEGAVVEVEKHIGTISADYLNGGRIDLCVFPREGRPLFIENKIYAADQENQLLRYHRFNPEAKLLYLTLDGAAPGTHSTGDAIPAEVLQTVSYATDIIAWLEACRKEAVTQPLVRETITQYLNLLKNLTGQSTNKQMTEEIKQLLLHSPDHLAGAQQLGNAFQELRAEVQRALHEELNNSLSRVLKGLLLPAEGNVFMHYKGYEIKFDYGADSSGYYWGFPGYVQGGDGGICKGKDFDEFYYYLQTLDSRFKRSNWYAGWINPSDFTRVENCSAVQLLELTSPAARQELAARTAKQASDCVVKLLERFGVGYLPLLLATSSTG